jgi:hypothetical protein
MVIRCSCGRVEFEAKGRPILTSVCYCDDCQKASRQLESLPGAPRLLGQDGGTPYILYRKDKVAFVKGKELLQDHRVEGEAFTKRVLASCCNSAMYLEYEKGHWLSLYRDRFIGATPPVQMRIQTQYKPEGAALPKDAPSFKAFPPRFVIRLLWARLAMALGL